MVDRWVVGLDEVGMGDVSAVGGKNASLGEMIQSLQSEGVDVPGGFATTSAAYRAFVRENRLDLVLKEQIAALAAGVSLRTVGAAVRGAFLEGALPDALVEGVGDAYRDLVRVVGILSLRESSTSMSPSAPAPPRRIFPMPASPANRRPISTFGVTMRC